MVGVVVLALASSGGGDKKKISRFYKLGIYTPLRQFTWHLP